jgi:hypothetical protein
LRPAFDGFDNSNVPDEIWWSAADLVSFSLAELYSDKANVICIPGEDNRQLVYQGLIAAAEKIK